MRLREKEREGGGKEVQGGRRRELEWEVERGREREGEKERGHDERVKKTREGCWERGGEGGREIVRIRYRHTHTGSYRMWLYPIPILDI